MTSRIEITLDNAVPLATAAVRTPGRAAEAETDDVTRKTMVGSINVVEKSRQPA